MYDDNSPEFKHFLEKRNDAIIEAEKEGISKEKLAGSLIISASHLFEESTELSQEYDTFAEFAKDIQFQSKEFDAEIKEGLRDVDRLLDEKRDRDNE